MKSEVAICSNVWTRVISLKKGECYEGHTHHFDHVHLLSLGKIQVTINGVKSIYEAPTQIIIKKELFHDIKCLSDESVGTCIHAIRDGKRVEDIFDPEMCPDFLEGEEDVYQIYPPENLVKKANAL